MDVHKQWASIIFINYMEGFRIGRPLLLDGRQLCCPFVPKNDSSWIRITLSVYLNGIYNV